MHQHETYDQYALRFENTVYQLEHAGADLGSAHDKGLHFFLSVNKPKLFKTIIKSVNTDASFFQHKTLRQFVDDLKKHHRIEMLIDTNIKPHGLDNVAPPDKPKGGEDNPHKQDHGKPGSHSKGHQPPSNEGFVEVQNPYNLNHRVKDEIKTNLLKASNKTQFFRNLLCKHADKCPIHIESKHGIADYRILEYICKDFSKKLFPRRCVMQPNFTKTKEHR